jgi:hypothetical protein
LDQFGKYVEGLAKANENNSEEDFDMPPYKPEFKQ